TVVMCTHGRGGLSRWLFGSVATRVLQSAAVPVLVVRPRSGDASA
ncbi:MAG: universal stress protein, partial [Candidatus Promineofilum sp.]|nr:universal stress protein [Promineifilum sp.]